MPLSAFTELIGPRFIFFGGKGGVGKSTWACATAIWLTECAQAATFLLSLDPAHSLGDLLATPVGPAAREVLPRLTAQELDAPAAFRAFMEAHGPSLRELVNRGTYLDDQDIDRFLRLSLPGLDELMGLLRLGELASDSRYRHIVVDLPPSGNALRLPALTVTLRRAADLMEALEEKHRFTVEALTHRYSPDAVDELIEQMQRLAERAQDAVFGAGQATTLVVSRLDAMVLSETDRYVAELRRQGVPLGGVVMNGLLPGQSLDGCPALQGRAASAANLPLCFAPWYTTPPAGTQRLLHLVSHANTPPLRSQALLAGNEGTLAPLLASPRRLTIFGGKGGVGKTTCAAAVALALSDRYPLRSVVLASIDPAHSLADVLGAPVEGELCPVVGQPNLQAVEIQAQAGWEEFQDQWREQLQAVGHHLLAAAPVDPVYDRRVLEQLGSLDPPGMYEVRSLSAVLDLLDEDGERLLIVDGAPTGQLIRLFEAPEQVLGWTREVMRLLLKYQLAAAARELSEALLELARRSRRLAGLLRDVATVEVAVVALPLPAVLAETARLLDDLERLRLPVRWLVLNGLRPRRAVSAAQEPARQAATPRAVNRLLAAHPNLRLVALARRAPPPGGVASLKALAA